MSMIFEKIKQILVEGLGCSEEDITMESNLIEDLDADSLDIVELSMTLEEEFEISVPDEDMEQLQKVGGIVEYIEKVKNQ